jgi:isocitrate dehydrogenase (NAD+)
MHKGDATSSCAEEKRRKPDGDDHAASPLGYGDERSQLAGRAIREASLEAVADGLRTADLGGPASSSEFTDEVIHSTKQKLAVWGAL